MVVGVVLLVAGVVLVVVGLLQARDRLPRNPLVGLRTSATMASDEAWYAAHRPTAAPVVAAGAVALAGGAAVVITDPSEGWFEVIVLGTAVVMVGLVVAAGLHGHRIAGSLDGSGGDEPPHPPSRTPG